METALKERAKSSIKTFWEGKFPFIYSRKPYKKKET